MSLYDVRIALRHLWRKKVYTLVIVVSLAIGFTCTGLLLSFVLVELNTDSFHKNAHRTVQLLSDDPFGGDGKLAYIPAVTKQHLSDNYPEIEHIVQMGTIGMVSLATPSMTAEDVQLLAVDSTFFSVFDYPLYAGNVSKALTPGGIVLSREKALVLFGNKKPLGETVTLKTADTTYTLMVSAILDHSAENSHLNFEALISQLTLKQPIGGGATYAVLVEDTDAEALKGKVNLDARLPGIIGEGKLQYDFEPIRESYFNASNKMTFMRSRSLPFLKTAALVCGVILFMAAFNFISLYLLSLQERRKNAGIRKTLGITSLRTLKSLTTEVGFYMFFAGLLTAFLITVVQPYVNTILESTLTFRYFLRTDLLLMAVAIVFVLAMVVIGCSLSQQNGVLPVSLMRGNSTSRIAFNKWLFTIQFVVSATLAVCAVTVIRQMHYLQTAPLGFNRDIVVLRAKPSQVPRLSALKNSLLTVPGVKHVSITSGSPVFGNYIARYELPDGKNYTAMLFSGDEDLMHTLNLQLVEGEFPTALKGGRVVNEALLRMFDLKDPIGQLIPGTEDVIIGVVSDFTVTSFKDEYPPSIISYSEGNSRMLIDFSGGPVNAVLPAIERAWKETFPGEYFSYHLIQEELMKKYKDDTFLFKAIVTYAVVSMVISGFGLFAMSWAVAQSRTKEVGIRKVLGARVRDIVGLLTSGFVKHILIAMVLAAPIGYYLMDKWLEQFSRKQPFDLFTFVAAGCVVAIVALLTMSVQTLRAAMSNPVEELKKE